MRRRFLYFIEGVSGCSEQMLQRLGIYDRFLEGAKLGAWVVRSWDADGVGSPSGKSGVLVASGQRPPAYDDARQTWTQDAGFYVGLEDAKARPGPMDLGLGVQIDGFEYTLQDGNTWRIPRVWKWNTQHFEHDVALPIAVRRRIVNGRPAVVKDVIPAYMPLIKIAERIWDSYTNQTVLKAEQLFLDACVLLSANYRVGAGEIDLLGLLNEDNMQQIMALAIDMPTLQAQAEQYAAQGLVKNTLPPDVDEIEGSKPEVSNG